MNDQTLIGLDEVAAVHTGLTPLYHSLGHVIRGKIQSGEWSVGQQIPSERALMEMFGVSRATVRQGIENLVNFSPALPFNIISDHGVSPGWTYEAPQAVKTHIDSISHVAKPIQTGQ